MPKIDIHNFERRLELIEAGITRMKLPKRQVVSIWKFRDTCLAQGMGLARVVKYMQSIKALHDRGLYRILEARHPQIVPILASIERSQLSEWTRHDYKLALRKYLQFLGREDLAAQVRLPPVHTRKLPEELLDQEDLLALLATANSSHDRAFIMALYESGCRIGELLSLQRKHVSMDSQGAVLIVDGKTGMRRVRLIESPPILDEWISFSTPKPDARIFPNTYRSYSKRLKVLAARAGIDKRVYPHLFRHSRATFLACYLTEAQLCAHMGWAIGSAMPRIYVHLAGHDLDAALARVPQLHNYVQHDFAASKPARTVEYGNQNNQARRSRTN